MKNKIIIAILLIVSQICNAQDILQMQNDAISQLDKTRIPYGVLYDKVVPVAEFRGFTKFIDSSVSNPIHFHQAYFEYYNSVFNTHNITTPQQLGDNIKLKSTDEFVHPLGILKIDFATLDSNVIEDGRLIVENEKLKDGTNSNSPYLSNKSIIVSVLDNGEEWDLGLHRFQFSPEFLLGNNTDNIKQFSIKINDQNWQHIDLSNVPISNWSSLLNFSFEFLNEDVFLTAYIKVELQNGDVFTSQFKKNARKKTRANNDIVIQGIDGGTIINLVGSSYPGINDYGQAPQIQTGQANVFYATNHGYAPNSTNHPIINPIIFFDGYDPTNSRTPAALYTRKMNQPVFINGQAVNFADHLRSIGFDLITINPDHQDRFIEENAMLLEDCLTKIWNTHNTTMVNDFVVIGPSLGGAICQFALAHMEHNNIPHHTRMYISFDTPHQGANVPIGLQNMMQYLLQGNFLNNVTSGALSEAKYNFFDNPSGRQLVAHHYLSGSQYPACDNWRNIFLNHLAAEGNYPQNLRKIALINGSINGTKNPFTNACSKFTELDYYRFQPLKWYFNWFGLPYLGPNQNPLTVINWRTFSGSENSMVNCENAKLFTYAPILNAVSGIPSGLTKFYSIGNVASRSLDLTPASFLGDVLGNSPKKLSNALLVVDLAVWLNAGFAIHNVDLNNIENSSFIPTTSSADIQQTSPDLYRNISNDFLSKCSGVTPFDMVYGENTSTEHVHISSLTATRTIQELTATPNQYQPYQLPQPTIACVQQSATIYQYTVTLPSPPSGQNYYWIISNNTGFQSPVVSTGNNLSSFVFYGTPNQKQDFDFNVTITLPNGCTGVHLFSIGTKNCNTNITVQYKQAPNTQIAEIPKNILYPNPANECIKLFLPIFPSYNSTFDIYDMLGKRIKTFNYSDYQTNLLEFPISDLSSGLYQLKINDGANHSMLKFEKQ